MTTRRFELVDDRSSKYWEVAVEGAEVTVRYGRIGTVGRTQTKGFETPDEAHREGDRLMKEKAGTGRCFFVGLYREDRMRGTGLEPVFPMWGLPTDALAREMIAGGLRARLTCVDPKQIPSSFAGRDFDEALLAELPADADPCGERGEFHTFAYDGPMFETPVAIASGDVVERDGFVFADVLPASTTGASEGARRSAAR